MISVSLPITTTATTSTIIPWPDVLACLPSQHNLHQLNHLLDHHPATRCFCHPPPKHHLRQWNHLLDHHPGPRGHIFSSPRFISCFLFLFHFGPRGHIFSSPLGPRAVSASFSIIFCFFSYWHSCRVLVCLLFDFPSQRYRCVLVWLVFLFLFHFGPLGHIFSSPYGPCAVSASFAIIIFFFRFGNLAMCSSVCCSLLLFWRYLHVLVWLFVFFL